jgi:pyruvate dehydrogenase E1 component alpha subunit
MNVHNVEHRFYSSAIVGGQLPIAVGVAAALKRKGCHRKVWCFLGDMAATTGAFHETHTYAYMHDLPIAFVIEDNGVSCNTPTKECWGGGFYGRAKNVRGYTYERTWPHVGIGRFVQF